MHNQLYLLYNSLLFFLLQCGRWGASVPPPCIRLQRDGAGLFQLVPQQAGLQHPWQWQHLRRDLPRRLVVQPVLLRQPQWRLLQGKCTQTTHTDNSSVGVRVRVSLTLTLTLLSEIMSVHHFLILQGGHYTPKGRGPLGPDGIVWYSWKDSDYYSLRKVSMMIRPRSFRTRLSPWTHRWWWHPVVSDRAHQEGSKWLFLLRVNLHTDLEVGENLGNSMFLKPWTHVYSPKTLYTVEFLFGTFFIQSVGREFFLIFYVYFVSFSLILWHTLLATQPKFYLFCNILLKLKVF